MDKSELIEKCIPYGLKKTLGKRAMISKLNEVYSEYIYTYCLEVRSFSAYEKLYGPIRSPQKVTKGLKQAVERNIGRRKSPEKSKEDSVSTQSESELEELEGVVQ